MARIKRTFFQKPTLETARALLGQIMCVRQSDGRVLKGKIVETEAYTQDEPSCHAFCGVTKRSSTLYMRAGTLYVYFTYGMYHCANVVTDKEGYGCAVLIRALEPLWDDANVKAAAGPGKLCRELNITRVLNQTDVCAKSADVWFEHGQNVADDNVVQTTRIGIKKAVELPWRFYIKDSKSVSKRI